MATGKAIDSALSRYHHEFCQRRRPTLTAMLRHSAEVLDEELAAAGLTLSVEDRSQIDQQLHGVLQAARRSEIFGLPRPKSRMILINESVGIYAQPDYWDGSRHIYEMKSYRAFPPSPEVDLQLKIFQLAFPDLAESLVCIDRHATPVAVSISPIPRISAAEGEAVLRIGYAAGIALGEPKVLEYVDSPIVRYVLNDVDAGPSG